MGKESTCNAWDREDTGLIPGSGRSSGGGNGNTLQYSCLKNSMDGGDWQAGYSPKGHKESDTDWETKQKHKHNSTCLRGMVWKYNDALKILS